MKLKQLIIFAFALFFSNFVFAQKHTPKNWQLLNPSTDKVYGMGVEEAYKLLKDKTPKKVIVAVIDCGVDIEHEDLKSIIWTNTNEIPDNGIDDDKNGYVDDVHGWSFLGGKTEDINYESFELSRIYWNLNKKYKNVNSSELSSSEQKGFAYYKKIKSEYLKEKDEHQDQLDRIKLFDDVVSNIKNSNNGTFSKAAVKKYKPQNKLEKKVRKRFKLLLTMGVEAKTLENQFKEAIDTYENFVRLDIVDSDSIRQAIVGDDPNDTINRFYGCNRVKGPDAGHGTHVAGIIAAVRGNNIGIDGVANNVLIMPVRAVPNGDERDKDIANAIRYAVDNGATVINMSFGKYYSPNKLTIDEAVKYAEAKDVLLIHAAGNESKDSDTSLSFPNRELYGAKIAGNWIQVGANSYKPGKKLIGDFSNYGLKRVDLFAPGVDVYSSIPENKYDSFSGTSMASPSVAGVAAILREYFPQLNAKEIREVLMKTVVHYNKPVAVPGTEKTKKKVEELCISGGFINAKAAVEELLKQGK